MFNGLSNEKRQEAVRTMTVENGQFVFCSGGTEHRFGHFVGVLTGVAVDEAGGVVTLSFTPPSGKPLVVPLPMTEGSSLRMLLPLASVPSFLGRPLDIRVEAQDGEGGVVKTIVTVKAGGKVMPWAIHKQEIPRVREALPPMLQRLAKMIAMTMEKDAQRAREINAPRVAPDIDDNPEGLE